MTGVQTCALPIYRTARNALHPVPKRYVRCRRRRRRRNPCRNGEVVGSVPAHVRAATRCGPNPYPLPVNGTPPPQRPVARSAPTPKTSGKPLRATSGTCRPACRPHRPGHRPPAQKPLAPATPNTIFKMKASTTAFYRPFTTPTVRTGGFSRHSPPNAIFGRKKSATPLCLQSVRILCGQEPTPCGCKKRESPAANAEESGSIGGVCATRADTGSYRRRTVRYAARTRYLPWQ